MGSFTVDPKISSFTPTSGPTGTTITVFGTGFGGADRVDFGGLKSATPTNVTPTSLKVIVPAGAATGQIKVHTAAGDSPLSVATFTVTFSVTGIAPTAGGHNQDIMVTGVGLTGVTAVKFNGIVGGAITANIGTSLHVTTPLSGLISGTVTVWKGLTANVAAPQQFTQFDVEGFTPTSGVPGTSVVITGHGFTNATHVRFSGTEVGFSVDSNTQITAQVPDGATNGTITVELLGGATATSVDSFSVTTQANLQINEVSPDVSDGADLVELKVVTSGSMAGIQLREAPSSAPVILATLPNVTVATDEIVVVHLNPPAGVTTETASKTECADATCYDSAWDVVGNPVGIAYFNSVLAVASASGTVEDGVAFVRSSPGSTSAEFQLDLGYLQSIGAWLPADCGGSPCTDLSTPSAMTVSADWDGVANPSTNTAQRSGDADTDLAADWTVGLPSLGATNP